MDYRFPVSEFQPAARSPFSLYDARVKSLKPRCACTGVVLWLSDPPRHGAEHPVDVRFAPTEAERRHKSGAPASRYANAGQDCGVLCASGTRLAPTVVNTKYGTIRKASFDTYIIKKRSDF